MSGCSWNAVPVMSYAAFTTVVYVENLVRTYQAKTVTQMTAICKINERKNKILRQLVGGSFQESGTLRCMY